MDEEDSSMLPETDQDRDSQPQSPLPMEREAAQDESPPADSGSAVTPDPTSPQEQQPPQVVGPRCAPTYSVVDALMDKKEDGPGPRCGHTLTAVPAVGEEGTPGYIGPRLVLFGGATALEGNSGGTGTPTSATPSAGIRMSFACLSCYQVKVATFVRLAKAITWCSSWK